MTVNMAGYEHSEVLAIPINAVNDVNPFQNMELRDGVWKIHFLDSFETFFHNPKNAKDTYTDIFSSVRTRLKETNSTKLTIKSHRTNADEIRQGETNEFKILITLHEGDEEIEFNLWALCSPEEVRERISERGIPKIEGIENHGLEGIERSKGDGYKNLFNTWIGWGTHNIRSTLESFQKTREHKNIRAVTPQDIDPESDYALRTSLFWEIDGEKVCLRTDAEEEQLNRLEEAVRNIQENIRHILITDQALWDFEWVWLHSVPTNFDRNVFHSVFTVVFNCEDKEAGKVIDAVIRELQTLLKDDTLHIGRRTTLDECLKDLIDLKAKLDKANSQIKIKKLRIKEKKNLIKEMNITGIYESFEVEAEENKLTLLRRDEERLSDARIDFLQNILSKLIQITNLTKTKENERTLKNGDLWRVSLITNGEYWSVWFIETNGHSIFFTNGILKFGVKEQRLFSILEKVSRGYIDGNIHDTTGCWDSSTAASLMVREEDGREERKRDYLMILKELGIEEDISEKAVGILEAYFLSTLQKVISGVVYHCRKSNLWDIPNDRMVARCILGFVFDDTLDFAKNGMNRFLYGDNSSKRKTRARNGFNIYNISSRENTAS